MVLEAVPDVEQMEARLIAALRNPGFSHAENILVSLQRYESEKRAHSETVCLLYAEYLGGAL